MYYEERTINGRLMCRYTPDGEWGECCIEKLNARLVEMESKLEYAQEINNKIAIDAYKNGAADEKRKLGRLLGLMQ